MTRTTANTLRLWRSYLTDAMILTAVFGIAFLLSSAAVQQEKDWTRFKQTHYCVKVGESSPQAATSFGITASGNSSLHTTLISGTTSWKCDDGVTYVRED